MLFLLSGISVFRQNKTNGPRLQVICMQRCVAIEPNESPSAHSSSLHLLPCAAQTTQRCPRWELRGRREAGGRMLRGQDCGGTARIYVRLALSCYVLRPCAQCWSWPLPAALPPLSLALRWSPTHWRVAPRSCKRRHRRSSGSSWRVVAVVAAAALGGGLGGKQGASAGVQERELWIRGRRRTRQARR